MSVPNGLKAKDLSATIVLKKNTKAGVYKVTVVYKGIFQEKGKKKKTVASCKRIVKFTVISVELEPVAAGNTPDLDPGLICINAQAGYKKAKWKTIVKPSGTATVTPVSGGVTVTGGAGLSDGATFWVEGGTMVGDYEIKITHDSLATCTETDGEKVFKFVKELEYDPKSITLNYVTVDGVQIGYPANCPPYHPHAYNIDNCANDKVNYKCVAEYWVTFPLVFHSTSADFTVQLNGKLGVATDPSGLYAGTVKAKVTSHQQGKVYVGNGVANYYFNLTGAVSLPFGKAEGVDPADIYADQEIPFNTDITANGTFTCGAKDATIVIDSHSCAQHGPIPKPDMHSGAEGSHTIDLSNYEISTP